MSRLRIVFMGTPDLAATCLSALLKAAQFEILAAVSQPDRPKGRHLQLQPTPVKSAAVEAGIPVLQPNRARDPGFLEQLRQLQPELIAVAAYGQILPQALLDIPRHGCLNVHTSLLPRYRGAAPIQWAILNGDEETGVTIMKIVPELDAGDILNQSRTAIGPEDDAQILHDRLAELGADLLVRTIPQYVEGTLVPTPQPEHGIVHARKITKNDGKMDWSRSATDLWNQVRGLVPWPAAFTHLSIQSKPTLIKIWKACPESQSDRPGVVIEANANGILVGCSAGSLRILELQPEGKRRMTAAEFLAGHRISPGDQFV